MINRYFCNPLTDDIAQTRLFRHAKGITPVPSLAVLELPGTRMSSIITAIEQNHTIALVGTSSGDLLKVGLYLVKPSQTFTFPLSIRIIEIGTPDNNI